MAFVLFQSLSFIVINLSWITVWFALLANINVGVITVIWCLKTPGVALTEYLFFGTELKMNYWIGIGMLMISAVALSIS